MLLCFYLTNVLQFNSQAAEIKNNISRFSGFVWHENEVIITAKMYEKWMLVTCNQVIYNKMSTCFMHK